MECSVGFRKCSILIIYTNLFILKQLKIATDIISFLNEKTKDREHDLYNITLDGDRSTLKYHHHHN